MLLLPGLCTKTARLCKLYLRVAVCAGGEVMEVVGSIAVVWRWYSWSWVWCVAHAVPVLAQQVEGVLAGGRTPLRCAEVTGKEVRHLQQHTAQHNTITAASALKLLLPRSRTMPRLEHTRQLPGQRHTPTQPNPTAGLASPHAPIRAARLPGAHTFLLPLLLNSPCSTPFLPRAAYMRAGS